MIEKIKAIFSKILIFIFVIFICLLVLEIYFRCSIPYNMALREVTINSDNPKILYELRPNSKIVFTGQYTELPPTNIKISSRGIRDYEYTENKPEEVYRIIILGDSTAFGWGVELEQTFSKYLERFLQEREKNKKYEVINFGVPGYNIIQEVATLEHKCLAYKPDLVIFYVDENDYKPLFNYFCPSPIFKNFSILFHKSYLIRWIFERLVYRMDIKNSREFEKGLIEVNYAIDRLYNIILANKTKVLFYPDIWWLRHILKRYNLDNLIIHSDKIVLNNDYYKNKNDGHPNVSGHKKIAQEIYNYLKINGYI